MAPQNTSGTKFNHGAMKICGAIYIYIYIYILMEPHEPCWHKLLSPYLSSRHIYGDMKNYGAVFSYDAISRFGEPHDYSAITSHGATNTQAPKGFMVPYIFMAP